MFIPNVTEIADSQEDDSFCHKTDLSDVVVNENKPRIFFLETSGECCLTPRQACSVESAIRTNPNANIILYMNTASSLTAHMREKGKKDFYGQKRSCAATKSLFTTWPNAKLIRTNLINYLKGTRLWTIVEDGLLHQSSTPFAHVSDMVRIAILWKYGGVYLDLDCFSLKSLDSLHNTLGMSDVLPNWIENGVVAFQSKHPFLRYLMAYMVLEFKPYLFTSIGPGTVSNAVQDFCERDDLVAGEPMICHNNISLTLQSHQAFYLIGSSNYDRELFFRPNRKEAEEYFQMLMSNSFVSHVYDAETKEHISENSLYGILANKFCPSTYRIAVNEGGF